MAFKNAQWEVTDFGIEAIRGAQPPGIVGVTSTYEIAANRLLELTDRNGKEYYDWPVHMADKTWVDIELFIEAFEQALEIHKGAYKGELDEEKLKLSLALGRRISEDNRAYLCPKYNRGFIFLGLCLASVMGCGYAASHAYKRFPKTTLLIFPAGGLACLSIFGAQIYRLSPEITSC